MDNCTERNKIDSIYRNIPSEMSRRKDLEDISEVIKSAICQYDIDQNELLKDEVALKILKLLIDRYYFNESVATEDRVVFNGYKFIESEIEKKLKKVLPAEIAKVVNTIYFVANRRSRGRREYLDFIRDFVEIRIAKGVSLKGRF